MQHSEQLLQAADAYGKERPNYLRDMDTGEVMREHHKPTQDFIAGADWQRNNAWHDKTEKPKFPCRLVTLDFAEEVCDRQYKDISDYNYEVNHYGLEKWAYYEDLVPPLHNPQENAKPAK